MSENELYGPGNPEPKFIKSEALGDLIQLLSRHYHSKQPILASYTCGKDDPYCGDILVPYYQLEIKSTPPFATSFNLKITLNYPVNQPESVWLELDSRINIAVCEAARHFVIDTLITAMKPVKVEQNEFIVLPHLGQIIPLQEQTVIGSIEDMLRRAHRGWDLLRQFPDHLQTCNY